MNLPDKTLEIQTLGRFSMLVNGKPVAADWPDESVKVLFCSLLSPLDLYITWDRISRSLWGVPDTRASRRRLEEILSRQLNSFLIGELGFNPLITGQDGIKIDQQRIHVDAYEFHTSAIEGLRLLSHGNHAAAFEQFNRAKSLYGGIYLPGIQGKIIANTRNDLESLYLAAILDAMPLTRNSWYSGHNRRAEPGPHTKEAQGGFKR